MGLCKKLASIVINFSLFFLIVTFSPGLPPKTTFPFEEFSLVKPKPLVGVLEPNNLLENPEKLHVGKLPGPEHLLNRDGAIYTALGNGDVVKIVGEKIEVIAKFGKLCYENNPKFICGRPLGLAFDTITENLIVVDTSTGIFELNLKTGSKKTLVRATTNIGIAAARPPRLLNSVTVAKNGDLYFTDSSSDYPINDCLMSLLVNPSGRLVHLARDNGKLTVLIDNLWFANGVALSPNEDFILVSDLTRSKIVKFWLKEGKHGESETFADGLPGTPDNLTPDKNGVWAALAITADPHNPLLAHSMASMPLVRKFFARLLSLVELTFDTVDRVYPNDFSKGIAQGCVSNAVMHFIFPNRATILRFDWNGNIIAAYHSFDGSFYTHVMEMDNHLYLGSFTHDYITKVVKRAHL